jgi:hypothetical protein
MQVDMERIFSVSGQPNRPAARLSIDRRIFGRMPFQWANREASRNERAGGEESVLEETVERAIRLEPYALLPEQVPCRQSNRNSIGERRLLGAMLVDAVRSLLFRPAESSRRSRMEPIRREAEAWILDDDLIWFFSFRNVCEVLGIDADRLRDGLRAAIARRKPARRFTGVRRRRHRIEGTG